MPGYYSPGGNLEEWATMPDGYFTVEEWEAAHPRPMPPPPTLEEAKTAKLAEITAEKNRRKQAGFIYMGKVFEADTASVQSLTLAAQSAAQALSSGQEFSREWTVEDDSKITLNAEQIIEIVLGIESRANDLQQEAGLLKEAVQAAETLADVEAVIWPSL